MKKISVPVIAIAIGISFLGYTTIAQTTELEKGYVSINESTTKEIQPNQAEISISVETSDISVKKATENNKIIANKVYSNLKASLLNNDYIKTGNYSVRPEYSYTKDNKRILDRYLVTNTIIVRTRNLELISKLIDTAIAQGATKIENLQFFATDYDNTCNTILTELTKKAYNKSTSIAQSINSQVLGIKSINATCNQESIPRPYYGIMAMKNAVDSASATPIEAGKIKIYANIDASFYVK